MSVRYGTIVELILNASKQLFPSLIGKKLLKTLMLIKKYLFLMKQYLIS